LRRKHSSDKEQKIPFLGEIPGIGKLFGATQLINDSTEMFIFITPTIVLDPEEELIQIRTEELKRRPGDIPSFLRKLVAARNKERKRFFVNSMEMFFGGNN
jgi:general secretion pathway protein D